MHSFYLDIPISGAIGTVHLIQTFIFCRVRLFLLGQLVLCFTNVHYQILLFRKIFPTNRDFIQVDEKKT